MRAAALLAIQSRQRDESRNQQQIACLAPPQDAIERSRHVARFTHGNMQWIRDVNLGSDAVVVCLVTGIGFKDEASLERMNREQGAGDIDAMIAVGHFTGAFRQIAQGLNEQVRYQESVAQMQTLTPGQPAASAPMKKGRPLARPQRAQ